MHTTNNKAAPRTGAASTPRDDNNTRKKLPLFKRLAGQVPDSVYITTDWNLAMACTRIVLSGDLPVEELELRFLAGLDAVIVHHEADEPRLPAITAAILKCNPRLLNSLNVDRPCISVLKRGAA